MISSVTVRAKKKSPAYKPAPRKKVVIVTPFSIAEGADCLKPTHLLANILLEHGSLNTGQLWDKVQQEPVTAIKNKTHMKKCLKQMVIKGMVKAKNDKKAYWEKLKAKSAARNTVLLSNDFPPFLWKITDQPTYKSEEGSTEQKQ